MQEAQAVISKRTIDARAVFEQNTSAGQMHHLRRSSLNQQSINGSQSVAPSTAPARKASLPTWPPVSCAETSEQVINNWQERHTGVRFFEIPVMKVICRPEGAIFV
jgi:hypothetical protein